MLCDKCLENTKNKFPCEFNEHKGEITVVLDCPTKRVEAEELLNLIRLHIVCLNELDKSITNKEQPDIVWMIRHISIIEGSLSYTIYGISKERHGAEMKAAKDKINGDV